MSDFRALKVDVEKKMASLVERARKLESAMKEGVAADGPAAEPDLGHIEAGPAQGPRLHGPKRRPSPKASASSTTAITGSGTRRVSPSALRPW